MDTLNSALREKPQQIEQTEQIAPGLVALQLQQIVTEIVGEDIAELLDFTENSSFILDLEMDSIKIVHLAERVNDLYGDRVDFVGWLSAKSVEEILALTIGDVAGFVEKHTYNHRRCL
jgi:acyl carrier protein